MLSLNNGTVVAKKCPSKELKFIRVLEQLSLLISRGFPLGAISRLHSACVRSIMLYATEMGPVTEEVVIRLYRNDAKVVR